MNPVNSAISVMLALAAFFGVYKIGVNYGLQQAKVPKEFYLPDNMWDEIHAYRLCQDNKTCRMFVKRADK